jgi:hypothetical protein
MDENSLAKHGLRERNTDENDEDAQEPIPSGYLNSSQDHCSEAKLTLTWASLLRPTILNLSPKIILQTNLSKTMM